jgi:hypothetical protein
MSSPYLPRSTQMRPRAISYNGLEGFTRPEIAASCGLAASEWGTWPKTGRRKPPPLAIGQDDENLLLPAPPWSAFSLRSSRSGWTPMTPASAVSDEVQTASARSQQSTPLLSRFNSAGLHSNASSSPTTPGPNQLPAKASAIELPGSLLLPSQGFPPPPATPPRHHILRRQDTDDSETSSVPSLTTLSSIPSSSDSMDVLKSLSGHHWKTSHTHGTTAHSNGNNKPSSVSKPFSAMSIEELLISLPSCDSNTITRIWMPEMQNKCRNMKEVLQKAHDNHALSNTELRNIGEASIGSSMPTSPTDNWPRTLKPTCKKPERFPTPTKVLSDRPSP